MAWIRRVLVAGGVALVAYAAISVLRAASVGTVPYLRFVVVSALFADVLVMPVALVAGALTARLLPAWVRLPVQAALYISAAVVVVSMPLLLGYGRSPLLPSALPRDYLSGVLVVLAAVWAAAVVAALTRWAAAGRTAARRTASRLAGEPRSGSRP